MASVLHRNFHQTSPAGIGASTAQNRPTLKYRLLFILIAIGAKVMFWSSKKILRLQDIHEAVPSKLRKFVFAGLVFPIFAINQLLFKAIIFLQQRLILQLDIKNCAFEEKLSRPVTQ